MLSTDLVAILFAQVANFLAGIGQFLFQMISTAVLQFIFDAIFGNPA